MLSDNCSGHQRYRISSLPGHDPVSEWGGHHGGSAYPIFSSLRHFQVVYFQKRTLKFKQLINGLKEKA